MAGPRRRSSPGAGPLSVPGTLLGTDLHRFRLVAVPGTHLGTVVVDPPFRSPSRTIQRATAASPHCGDTMTVLPMFPLGTVLLPGAVLPLHVFEPRYRALVADCLAGEPEFGVVLIERGSEVGGGDVRRDVGTVARIMEMTQLPGDRYALVTVGTRRIRVERWLDDEPYPRAEVTAWPEADDGGQGPVVEELLAQLRRVLA